MPAPPTCDSMERDWNLPDTQTFCEYSVEEAEARAWAQRECCCIFCGMCNMMKSYAVCTKIPFIYGTLCCPFMMNTQTRYFCQLKCCMVPICDPASDAFEVMVPSAFTGGLPEIMLPGPEVRRLLGYMLNETPKVADAFELENLWHAMREVLHLKQAKAEELELVKLKDVMKKLLTKGAAREGKNSVISTYYRTDAFGDQCISINGGPPLAVGVAVSKAVKDSITSSGRDVLFDPNESSFLNDMRRFLKHKAATNSFWKRRVERALRFLARLGKDDKGEDGARLWALTYALALTRAAQSRSPVIVLRKCAKGGSGKAYPKYGNGQDFEMDFMERRRNLDEAFASAGCKPCWPLLSSCPCLPSVVERFCVNGVKPLLRNLGKSHMIVIEHEDSVDGVANLIAALHGGEATIAYGAMGADGQLKDPTTLTASAPAPKNLVPDMVKAVSAPGATPDLTMDHHHERNGLISMVSSSSDWGKGQAGAHVRLRMATVGRPDLVWTADMKGDAARKIHLMPEDPNAICPQMNLKACGCFYQCSGQVKNGGVATNTPRAKVQPA